MNLHLLFLCRVSNLWHNQNKVVLGDFIDDSTTGYCANNTRPLYESQITKNATTNYDYPEFQAAIVTMNAGTD
ncbi:hypothetical protein T10_4494 [Trichinella papuae]|uniref:Uncharacterized protein n=1 Tax=Trichinella papuae TaxID=268474 RepID=A0A0V1MT73_9BILA|nr:hypothetical protein T10_4494 [Trichinella papuae]